jgi:Trypsin
MRLGIRLFTGLSCVLGVLLLSSGAALATSPRVPTRVPGRLPSSLWRSPGAASESSVRVLDSSSLEDRAFGRIFGIDPREGPYSCSGTSLNTPSGSIVLTAGHCVLEHHRWGRHILFVPAYDHGARPFGSFETEAVYTMPQWRETENSDFDIAALKVAPNKFGVLAEVVGARGYEFDQSRFDTFQIFGYPAGASAGEELRSCTTQGLGSDSLTTTLPGPPTVPARCNMASGSSGGAWIVGGRYVDGLTSYGYAGNFTHLYSPYFGSEVGAFLSRLP